MQLFPLGISIAIQSISQQDDVCRAVQGTHTERRVFSLFPTVCCQRLNNSGHMDGESEAVPILWPMIFMTQQRETHSRCAFRCHSRDHEQGADFETPTLKMGEEITIHIVQSLL